MNSRSNIEFFAWRDKQETQIDTSVVQSPVLSDFYGDGDRERIERNWKTQLENGFKFSNSVGSLYSTRRENGKVAGIYLPTEYLVYNAVAFPHSESEVLSEDFRKRMRVSSVGGVVITADEKTLVQKRAEGMSAAGLYDSAAAGFCPLNTEGQLDFNAAVREKLKRELKVEEEHIGSLHRTGLWSSMGYDFSGMVGYVVSVNLTFEQIVAGMNQKYVGGMHGLEKKDVPGFIMDHYTGTRDLISDGCASLLCSLDRDSFDGLVKEINERGRNIAKGTLLKGQFIPDSE